MINTYCRKYREQHKLTLKQVCELTGNTTKIGTLSSFEHGKSTNIQHLETYIKLSKQLNDLYNFMNNLSVEVIKHG